MPWHCPGSPSNDSEETAMVVPSLGRQGSPDLVGVWFRNTGASNQALDVAFGCRVQGIGFWFFHQACLHVVD